MDWVSYLVIPFFVALIFSILNTVRESLNRGSFSRNYFELDFDDFKWSFLFFSSLVLYILISSRLSMALRTT